MKEQFDIRAGLCGLAAALINVVAIYLGSGGLKRFDMALVPYTSACVFATFGIVYRYAIWLQKPPTGMYWRRGWQIFFRPKDVARNTITLVREVLLKFAAQKFIMNRGHLRWAAHLLLSWGCLAACAVTFPLVFGWVSFEADPARPENYQALVFGVHAGEFPAHSLIGWVTFHILDFCAVAVLAGMGLAMKRRMHDPGAIAVQQFSMDFLPIILLFMVCVTGLMLTASSLWMRGYSYSFIAVLHAFSVIVTLLYLPFGKFFHIFQRPANLGVQFYKQEGRETAQAACKSCGDEYASALHVADLKQVLDELGLDQRFEDGTHYQDICPRCRRRLLAANQLKAIGGDGFI